MGWLMGLEPKRPGNQGASRGILQSERPSILPLCSRFLSQIYPRAGKRKPALGGLSVGYQFGQPRVLGTAEL